MRERATYAIEIKADLLADERGNTLVKLPLIKRRGLLEEFATKFLTGCSNIRLSPATPDVKVAKKWFQTVGGNLDGLIAKRVDMAYRSGERDGMQKIKKLRTVDCVVGGFRYGEGKKVVGLALFPNCLIYVSNGTYLTHIFWPLAENRTRWEIHTYSPKAKTLAERFSQEYGKVSFRDTLLEDGSTLERTQSMLASGAKQEIVLQDEELLIRQHHYVTETYLNA